jgi:hypothetical protein
MIIRKQQNFDAVSGEEKYKESFLITKLIWTLSWVSFKKQLS